ncbi:MAG TPA: peroxidase family protein, partial [Alphaproteobacteria bacterium]|nr:peroxidase family protein [Alphaproteobacteria bacterium]
NLLPVEKGFFVGGDERVNENAMLTSFHTLFVREHNRLVDAIKADNPAMTDEQVYQKARHTVAGQIQAITYNEYLPLILGENSGLPAYGGYDESVNATIANVFATAAFRVGHTQLNAAIRFEGLDGTENLVPLEQCFFNPGCFTAHGVGATLVGMAGQRAQEIDTKLDDAIRNMLITAPGVTQGVDLTAINMQRGRDHGLPSYGEMLAALNLGESTIPDSLKADLLALYGSLSEVDVYIGGLAEAHFGDGVVGKLFHAVLSDQFLRLREGDRFFYLNGELFDPAFSGWLDSVTLADIVGWNTEYEIPEGANMFMTGEASGHPIPVPAPIVMLGTLVLTAGIYSRRQRARRRAQTAAD